MKRTEINEGTKFNSLTIIREVEKLKRDRAFLCKCDCGKETVVRLCNLTTNHTRSCGCLLTKSITKHGFIHHRLYATWNGMMQRCTNKSHIAYNNYGGRGITVCDEWENIENFIKDMDSTYQTGLTLDRIDNSKGYSKYNCRWSTLTEQHNNTRTNAIVEYNGKNYTQSELSRKLNINLSTLRRRLASNKPLV